MEIIENNFNKKLTKKHRIECKNCKSQLYALESEIARNYKFADKDGFKWHDGIGIYECPCCHKKCAEVIILESETVWAPKDNDLSNLVSGEYINPIKRSEDGTVYYNVAGKEMSEEQIRRITKTINQALKDMAKDHLKID